MLDDIAVAARRTWELASGQARHVAHPEPTKHGLGYKIPGAIAQYVTAAVEGGMGERVDSIKIDLVRQYLKSTGNMLALEPIEGTNKRRWVLFISKEWKEKLPTVVVTKKERFSDKELGNYDFPVEVRTVNKVATTVDIGKQPLSQEQVDLLRALESLGGEVKANNSTGKIAEKAHKATGRSYNPSSFSALADRGLIERDVKGKRTLRVKLTEIGRIIVQNPWPHMQGSDALAEYLQQVGRFEGTSPRKTTAQLADALGGVPRSRITTAIRALEDEGLVKSEKTSDVQHAPYLYVEWVGNGEKKVAEKPLKLRKNYDVDSDDADIDSLLNLVKQLYEAAASESSDTAELEALKTQNEECRAQLDLISEVMDRVNQGVVKPIQALAEIQAVLE